ncbi:hypothetical protein JCM8547_008143 [Rhodosporidiobolus lusitaniae]
MPSRKALLLPALVPVLFHVLLLLVSKADPPFLVQLLSYLSTTAFIRNLPSLVNPPDLPASFAVLPFSPSSSSKNAPVQFTVHSSEPTRPRSERLAYCEDAIPLTVGEGDAKKNLVLVSCDPNRKSWNTVMGPLRHPYGAQGALWIVDSSPEGGKEPEAKRVEMDWPALEAKRVQFHPLGIEVVESSREGDEQLLLAINHGAKESTIELFSLSSSSLTAKHLHTIELHPNPPSAPNSLAVLPSSTRTRLRFFLSHDHRFNKRSPALLRKLANTAETILSLPLAQVSYVEVTLEKRGYKIVEKPAITGIPFANGLALSSNGETLVVASTTRKELLFYSVPSLPSASSLPSSPFSPLTLTRKVSLPFLVDNLSVLPSNNAEDEKETFTVLAAGHPSYPALLSVAHSLRLSTSSLPSLVQRFLLPKAFTFDHEEQRGMSWAVSVIHPAKEGSGKEWETVFQSNGRVQERGFGGSTTAIGGRGEDGKGWMVVAGLYEEGVKVVRER